MDFLLQIGNITVSQIKRRVPVSPMYKNKKEWRGGEWKQVAFGFVFESLAALHIHEKNRMLRGTARWLLFPS